MRELQEKAYSLKNSSSVEELEQLALELASINFSLTYYSAVYEDAYMSREEQYKYETARTFMEEKGAKRTDGYAENMARQKHKTLRDEKLVNYKLYKFASGYHKDVDKLIDVLRGRASTLKKER